MKDLLTTKSTSLAFNGVSRAPTLLLNLGHSKPRYVSGYNSLDKQAESYLSITVIITDIIRKSIELILQSEMNTGALHNRSQIDSQRENIRRKYMTEFFTSFWPYIIGTRRQPKFL